tara:strand:+ start:342 stop:620 length:279 start_codon:yes stop_codon:yes gene_type:complete
MTHGPEKRKVRVQKSFDRMYEEGFFDRDWKNAEQIARRFSIEIPRHWKQMTVKSVPAWIRREIKKGRIITREVRVYPNGKHKEYKRADDEGR